MDQRIILSAICSFIFFLFLHVLIFRRINQKEVLIWIVKTCLIGSIFPVFFSLIVTYLDPINGYSIPLQFAVIFFISFILYSLLAILYILGPFGIIESSLRIRLLEEIAGFGEKGVSKQNLFKVYNKNVIIQKRLNRFLMTKDFTYRNGYYLIKNRFSYFIVQEFLFENMKRIYSNGKEKSNK
jgi:hypothetical protein